MDSITIKKASAADFAAIAQVIADQNKHPEKHCIQSDTGPDARSIQNELARLDATGSICFVLALQNGTMVGVLGCELDEELGRGWVRGPFVLAEPGAWEDIACALLDGLQAALPAAIHWLDSYLNIANERGNQFYAAHGFKQLRLAHVYEAHPYGTTAFDRLAGNAWGCAPLDPLQVQAFVTLHHQVFPRTYATGQRIVDALDGNHQVFIYTEGDELLGYVYTAIDEDSGEGSVEFIGVREDARGKGAGRKLLRTALDWLFETKKVPQAVLVVNDDLSNARSLYESVGFCLKYTGVHARKEW